MNITGKKEWMKENDWTRERLRRSSDAVTVLDDADEAPAADSEPPAATDQASAPDPASPDAPTPAPTLNTPPADSSQPKATSTPRTGGRRRSQKAAKAAEASVIDLTMEEEEAEAGTEESDTSAGQNQDVKPDVNELNRQMQQNDVQEGEGEGAGTGNTGDLSDDLDLKVRVKEEEDTRLGQLRHKYKLLTQRFHNLQRNVHKLLSFIVPDVDLGSADDIEHIVTEMIRVNCTQETSSSVWFFFFFFKCVWVFL